MSRRLPRAALFALLLLAHAAIGAQQVLRLDQAEILLDANAALPPPDAAWQPQGLPDTWAESRPGTTGAGWYRIRFVPGGRVPALSAFYVPRSTLIGAAYLNGEAIGVREAFDERHAREWYRPQLFIVPAKLLVPGLNTLQLRVLTYPNHTRALSEVYFGPLPVVQDAWQRRFFWQITTVQITSALTLGMGTIALLAWIMLGRELAYAYFGGAALCSALSNLQFLVTELPVSPLAWEVLATTLLIWSYALICLFILRFIGRTRGERWILVFCAFVPVPLALGGAQRLDTISSLLYLAGFVIAALVVKVAFSAARRQPSTGTFLLVGASLLAYPLLVLDWLNHRGNAGFNNPYTQHFAAPLLFVVVAWNMFQRFRDARRQARELALSLEDRVRQKSAELERSHERLRAIEASRAQAQERSRIMQDMHDGLGSQLVSSLALAQGGNLSAAQTSELLRNCIDDLRLAVDASSESGSPFAIALGNLRFRLDPRLAAAGIRLAWSVHDVDTELPLARERVLPLLRILQESIANTLKHAHARTLHVDVAAGDGQLVVDLRDDGTGFDVARATSEARGKGLASLHKRARMLGAQLAVDSGEGGTHVRLTVPLDAPDPAASENNLMA